MTAPKPPRNKCYDCSGTGGLKDDQCYLCEGKGFSLSGAAQPAPRHLFPDAPLVTREQAQEAALALIDHFFQNGKRKVKICIPAEQDDTDTLLMRYLRQPHSAAAPVPVPAGPRQMLGNRFPMQDRYAKHRDVHDEDESCALSPKCQPAPAPLLPPQEPENSEMCPVCQDSYCRHEPNEQREIQAAYSWLINGGNGHEDGEDGVRALRCSGSFLVETLAAYALHFRPAPIAGETRTELSVDELAALMEAGAQEKNNAKYLKVAEYVLPHIEAAAASRIAQLEQKMRVYENSINWHNPLTSQISAADIDIDKLTAILAAEMPRWVPVAERMPNEIGDYLVWVDFTLDGIRSCYWDIATYGAGGWPDKATHWLDGVPSPPSQMKPRWRA